MKDIYYNVAQKIILRYTGRTSWRRLKDTQFTTVEVLDLVAELLYDKLKNIETEFKREVLIEYEKERHTYNWYNIEDEIKNKIDKHLNIDND
jgi:hypothetical protein